MQCFLDNKSLSNIAVGSYDSCCNHLMDIYIPVTLSSDLLSLLKAVGHGIVLLSLIFMACKQLDFTGCLV